VQVPSHSYETYLVLSLDVMDTSGEVQTDVAATMFKTRLDQNGQIIDTAHMDLGFNYEPPPADYCGPCYGGKPTREDGCCNTCKDVRDAYTANGWGVGDYNAIEQCAREQFTPTSNGLTCSYKENLLSQSREGCNLAGSFQVNKVSGNFHIAPGRSFALNGMHVHDTVHCVIYSALTGSRNISIKIKKKDQRNMILVI